MQEGRAPRKINTPSRAQKDRDNKAFRERWEAQKADHRPPLKRLALQATLIHRTSPYPKHSDAWCLESSLLADAYTRRNKTLKKLRQADEALLKIEERRDELLSAIALENPAVDSHDPIDLELLHLQHIIALKLKTRQVSH